MGRAIAIKLVEDTARELMARAAIDIPPDYRDRYYDSNEAWYRYSDGYIYEIDPATLLVRQVIELLTNT